MDRSQYPDLMVFAGLGRASAQGLGGVSSRPEKNVLSFFAEIAYRLILQELWLNPQYDANSLT
jgi:hypothetical protein